MSYQSLLQTCAGPRRPFLPAALLASALAAPWTAAADDTLFTQLGGLPVITTVATTAGAMYRSDPRLRPYFDNINPDWLRPRIIAFVCQISGGPCKYPGRTMAASHKGLHIDEVAFKAFMEDFQTAMQNAGVPEQAQTRLLSLLTPMGHDIVTR